MTYYLHVPISKVWIYRLLFVCFLFVCTVTNFPPRINLAASNFARRFIGVLGRKSPILGNFASTKVQNGVYASVSSYGGLIMRVEVHLPIRPACWQCVGLACIDNQLSPKTVVLVFSLELWVQWVRIHCLCHISWRSLSKGSLIC